MAQEIGGTAYIKIGAVQYNLRGALKTNQGGKVRTPVMGADGTLHGFTSKYKEATAEFMVSDSGTLDVVALRAVENSTVTIELGNGKTYILPAASRSMTRTSTTWRARSASSSPVRP